MQELPDYEIPEPQKAHRRIEKRVAPQGLPLGARELRNFLTMGVRR